MPYNPSQPRDPAGSKTGGQWTSAHSGKTASQFWRQTYPGGDLLPAPPADILKKLQEGGFSLSTKGESPTDGYMVAIRKDTEQAEPLDHVTADDLTSYVNAHRSELQQPRAYLGGWVDPKDGVPWAYLDVSINMTDLDQVMKYARENQQLGVYDVKNGSTVYVDEYFRSKGQAH